MPSATSSGADAKPNGNATNRMGNQDRKYTIEQKAAVLRVRRCGATAFYDILGLEDVKATVTEAEIKKAYRKQSLLTHPDKNGHEHADEAFKMVSRAFGVLGDKEKRSKFDRFGGDPDSRFGGGGGGGAAASPFSGFGGGRTPRRGGDGMGGGMWEDEISPEEMFNRFFGGGFGGGGMFNDTPGFVFNMGGGPGIRVHQFGGRAPRRRPRDPNAPEEPPPSLKDILKGLLPLLLVLFLPLISSIFSGSGSSSGPSMRFDGSFPPHTMARHTNKMNVHYWVNPAEVDGYTSRQFTQLDQTAEIQYVQRLRVGCEDEVEQKNRLMQEAQGFFRQDTAKMNRARTMDMPNCRILEGMGLINRGY